MPSFQQALQHLALAWVDTAAGRAQLKMSFLRGVGRHCLASHACTGKRPHEPLHPARLASPAPARPPTGQGLVRPPN